MNKEKLILGFYKTIQKYGKIRSRLAFYYVTGAITDYQQEVIYTRLEKAMMKEYIEFIRRIDVANYNENYKLSILKNNEL